MSDSDVSDAIMADEAMDAQDAVPTTDEVAVESDTVVDDETPEVAVPADDVADDDESDEPPSDDETAPTEDADDLDDLLGLAGADDEDADEDAPTDSAATDADESGESEGGDDEPDAAPARPRRPQSMEDVRDRRDLIRLSGDWYVVHTYSGYEQRVKDNLTNRIEALAAEDRIFELVIPTEEVTEFKKGKKQTSEKKFLPGYVLIRMDLDDETWNIVRHTPAVTGFVGATASKPVPLSLREVAATLKVPDRLEEPKEGEEVVEDTKPQVREIDLEEGETVRVTTGPFADFTGTIAEINLDQAKLRVMVSVFGRETPLEMPFDQVAKVT